MCVTSGRRSPSRSMPSLLSGGERLEGEIKYYDYGVVSVIYQLSFSGDWESLVRLASRWVWDVDFAARVEPVVRQRLERAAPAMVKPYARWLSEDYFIFHLRDDDRNAFGCGPDSRSRSRDRADCPRRPAALVHERVRRGSAVAHLLLRKRSRGDRMECCLSFGQQCRG